MVKGKEIGRWFESRLCSWFILCRFGYKNIGQFTSAADIGAGIDQPTYQMILDKDNDCFYIIYEMSPEEFDRYEGKIDELGNRR